MTFKLLLAKSARVHSCACKQIFLEISEQIYQFKCMKDILSAFGIVVPEYLIETDGLDCFNSIIM